MTGGGVIFCFGCLLLSLVSNMHYKGRQEVAEAAHADEVGRLLALLVEARAAAR